MKLGRSLKALPPESMEEARPPKSMKAGREARAPEILALATGPMKAVREVERMPGHLGPESLALASGS